MEKIVNKAKPYNNFVDLQLVLIRIYIGLNFVHHFSEKFGLLGAYAYNNVVHYFANMGFSLTIVFIAGLCEFAIFVGFTFGLFTRFAAVGTALYLIIALFSGRHELVGFTWSNHASGIMLNGRIQTIYGGWEYPLFLAFICLTFILTGGRKWSIDSYLRNYNFSILKFLSK